MKQRFLKAGVMSAAVILCSSMNIEDVTDYLAAGNQLQFNNERYLLAWTSHPSGNYYKQEYLKEGEKLATYHNMILVEDVEANDVRIGDVLNTTTGKLNERKKWDFVANYKVYENKEKPDEAMIDFVISDTMTKYEWNLYRYQIQKSSTGETHLVLMAYSYRDSLNDDNDLKRFFNHIVAERTGLLNKLQEYPMPKIAARK